MKTLILDIDLECELVFDPSDIDSVRVYSNGVDVTPALKKSQKRSLWHKAMLEDEEGA